MPANLNYHGSGSVSVLVDDGQIAAIQKQLGDIADASSVIGPALNETATHIRAEATRRIREDLNLNAGEVRAHIKITKKAGGEEMTAVVTIDYQKVALEDFNARFRGKSGGGVRVTTVRPEGPKVFKHMFQATMQSGHIGIFENRLDAKHVAKGGRYAGRLIKRGPRKGQPILRHGVSESYGPSVVASGENAPSLMDDLAEDGAEYFEKRVASKIEAKLAGAF